MSVVAVSGELAAEDEETMDRRAALLAEGKFIQDYLVVPNQLWLDGIANGNGTVRQFVATPLGSGYSVEAQIRGHEHYGGIQVEVTPLGTLPRNKSFYIYIKALSGGFYNMRVNSGMTVGQVKEFVQNKGGIPSDQQHLIFTGMELEGKRLRAMTSRLGLISTDHRPLYGYNIMRVSNYGDSRSYNTKVKKIGSYLILDTATTRRWPSRAFEDATENIFEDETSNFMGVGGGGLIRQSIKRDTQTRAWDANNTALVNIQILNARFFERFTGLKPLHSPVTAKTYAKAKLPYFEIPDELPGGVYGDFHRVKSINHLDNSGARTEEKMLAAEEVSTRLPHPVVLLDVSGRHRGFRPVEEMVDDVDNRRRRRNVRYD